MAKKTMTYYAVYVRENDDIKYVIDSIFVLKIDAEEYYLEKDIDPSDIIIKEIDIYGVPFEVSASKSQINSSAREVINS